MEQIFGLIFGVFVKGRLNKINFSETLFELRMNWLERITGWRRGIMFSMQTSRIKIYMPCLQPVFVHRNGHPKLSFFVKQMVTEEQRWIQAVEDFRAAPIHGISGRGNRRIADYVEQDRNLAEIYRTRNERTPLDYLEAISYRMPNPV